MGYEGTRRWADEPGESSRSGARRVQDISHATQHAAESDHAHAAARPHDSSSFADAMLDILQDFREQHNVEEYLGLELAKEAAQILENTSPETQLRAISYSFELHNIVEEELESHGPGMLQQMIASGREQQVTEMTQIPTMSVLCGHCSMELGPGARFYRCTDCDESNHQVNSTYMCCTCFIGGEAHEHGCFKPWEIAPGGLRQLPPSRNPTEWDSAFISCLLTSDEPHAVPLTKDSPISQVLQRYLSFADLDSHLHYAVIDAVMNIQGSITSEPAFQTFKHWAITCFLISDHDFTRRTGHISFMDILSPSQRISLSLLKEWWFSEIQDSTFVMKTISSLANDCLPPDHVDEHRFVADHRKNRYEEHYHGDLLILFNQEFQTLESGNTVSSPEILATSRRFAVNSACCQRMGNQAMWQYLEPQASATSRYIQTHSTVQMNCYRWRRDVIRACYDLLWSLRLENSSEATISMFWLLMDVITEGPIQLFTESSLHPGKILEVSRMSVFLEPLPWLCEVDNQEDRPYFLWDRRDSRTVETAALNEPLDYIAISHTWGRWEIQDQSVILPGTEWPIPANSIWHVHKLPDLLRKVPGHQRYLWFDLVCIPQGRVARQDPRLGHLQASEIAKQAAIFGKAAHAVAWLNTMTNSGLEDMHTTIFNLALASGDYYERRSLATEEDRKTRATRRVTIPFEARGKDQRPRTARNCTPLVEEEARGEITEDDSQLYVNRWFTSLWTLQEACMRPDMWVCDRDWNLLRVRPVSTWDSTQNISLDAIFALMSNDKMSGPLAQEPEPGYEGSVDDVQAKFDKLNEQFADENAFNFSDLFEYKAFMENALHSSGLPTGQLPDYNVEDIEKAMFGAHLAARGEEPKSVLNILKKLPLEVHILDRMLRTTGMTSFAKLTSRMDIVAIGERRTCKRPHDRAKAIMSAVGAVDWYDPQRSEDHPDSRLIMGQYPVAFIREIRSKVGNGDFFRSRTLNKGVVRLIQQFEQSKGTDVVDYVPVGSVLPFSNSSVLDIWLAPPGWPEGSRPIEGQSALLDWTINEDGSVHVPKAAIVADTRHLRSMPGCGIRCILIKEDAETTTRGKLDFIETDLDKLLEQQAKVNGVCFLVNISRQRLLTTERLGLSSCHGIVLRELKPGVLVKIGMYALNGHEFYTWPPATRRNWVVL